MQNRLLLNGRKGFSLIETMVSVAIVAILIAVMFGMFNSGILFTTQTRHRFKALHLASGYLDQSVQLLMEASARKDFTFPCPFVVSGDTLDSD